MGHGKETPRQKMIGMMYLVLTALLALNVSKDVLNAFVIVDEGLSKTVENFYEKNDAIYKEFAQAAATNPKKAKKWSEKAEAIRNKANEINNKIQDLKIQIINLADKPGNLAVKDRTIITGNILSKDNADKPAQIMVGDNNNGQGKELKKLIEEYREMCLKELDPKAEEVKAAIEKSLETKDPEAVEGKKESWESEHFEHMR